MSKATVPGTVLVEPRDLIRVMIGQEGPGQEEALVLNVHGLTAQQTAELDARARALVHDALTMRVDNYRTALASSEADLKEFQRQSSNGNGLTALPAPTSSSKIRQGRGRTKTSAPAVSEDRPEGKAGQLCAFIREADPQEGISNEDQVAWAQKKLYAGDNLDDATVATRISAMRVQLKAKGLIKQVSDQRGANWCGISSRASSSSGNGRKAETSNGLRPGSQADVINKCIQQVPKRGRTFQQICEKTGFSQTQVRPVLAKLFSLGLIENRGEARNACYFPKGSGDTDAAPATRKAPRRRRSTTSDDVGSDDENATTTALSVKLPDTPEAEVDYPPIGKRSPSLKPEWTWILWKMLTDSNRKGQAKFDDLVKAVKKESATYGFNTSLLSPDVIHNGLMSGYTALVEAGDLVETEDRQTVIVAALAKKLRSRQKTAKAAGNGSSGSSSLEPREGSASPKSKRGIEGVDVHDIDFDDEDAWQEVVRRVLQANKKKKGLTEEQVVEAVYGNGTVSHPHPGDVTREQCEDGVNKALGVLLDEGEIAQDDETESYSLV